MVSYMRMYMSHREYIYRAYLSRSWEAIISHESICIDARDALYDDPYTSLIFDLIRTWFYHFSFFSREISTREFVFSRQYEYWFLTQYLYRYSISVWDSPTVARWMISLSSLSRTKRRTAHCNPSRCYFSRTQCIRHITHHSTYSLDDGIYENSASIEWYDPKKSPRYTRGDFYYYFAV